MKKIIHPIPVPAFQGSLEECAHPAKDGDLELNRIRHPPPLRYRQYFKYLENMRRYQTIGKSLEALERVYGKMNASSRVKTAKNDNHSGEPEQCKKSSMEIPSSDESSSSISTITISSPSSCALSSSCSTCDETSDRSSDSNTQYSPTTTRSGRRLKKGMKSGRKSQSTRSLLGTVRDTSLSRLSSSCESNKAAMIGCTTGTKERTANLKEDQKLRLRDPVNYSEEEYYDSIGIPRTKFKGKGGHRHRRCHKTRANYRQKIPGDDKGIALQGADLQSENQSKCLNSENLNQKGPGDVNSKTSTTLQRSAIEVGITNNLAWPEYWDVFLRDPSNRKCIAPVNLFPHAPLADMWKEYATISLVIEVPNPYVNLKSRQTAYWIGSVLEFSGYRALVQLERFDMAPTQCIWIPFCSSVPQPLGFADKTGKTLYPAIDVAKKYPKFIEKARQTMTNLGRNLYTLRANNPDFVSEKIASGQIYKLGTKLEVIDINAVHQNQIGTVTALIGDRIRVAYDLPKRGAKYDYGNFLNVKSPFIHPLGWSQLVGHELFVLDKTDYRKQTSDYKVEDPQFIDCDDSNISIKVGMALEIRSNPPYNIVPAIVSKVLKFGYFMAEFKPKDKKDRFKMCFHINSPYVLPCGFCLEHGIEILSSVSSKGCEDSPSDCNNGQSKHLHVPQLPKITHSFKEGMKLEAVDLMQPHVIRPATIVKIAGHLLKLYFDGRPKEKEDSFQWVSAESHDIYPLGWSEMVGHRFEGYPVSCMDYINDYFPEPQIVSVKSETKPIPEAEPIESEEDVAAYAESLIGSLALSECADSDIQTSAD